MSPKYKLIFFVLAGFFLGALAAYVGSEVRYGSTYYNCNPDFTGCFAVAKFDDRETCERYRSVNSMLCDKTNMPERLVCTKMDHQPIGIGKCSD